MVEIPKITTFTPGRFLVCSGTNVYPQGGAGDFDGAFRTIGEALAFCHKPESGRGRDFAQIVDVAEGVIYELQKEPFEMGSLWPEKTVTHWEDVPWRLPVDDDGDNDDAPADCSS